MISVIVPVYNVAPYLKRCIDSILSQTYSQLEVILIDDGSMDESPDLCDKYQRQDKRISVVHKTNAGLSAARNTGLDIASGDYVVFIDSDDWIHPRCLEMLMSDISNNHTLLAISDLKRTSGECTFLEINRGVTILAQSEVIPRFLHGEWISACGKLYHRSLWNNNRFPEGLNNEDYAILIKIFEQCETVTYRKDPLYYYYIHEGSISHSVLNLHSFDEIKTGQIVWEYCKANYPQWANIALFNLTASIIKLTGECLETSSFMDKYEEMKHLFISNKNEMLNNSELSIRYKPFLWSMMCGKVMHQAFVKAYNCYAKR